MEGAKWQPSVACRHANGAQFTEARQCSESHAGDESGLDLTSLQIVAEPVSSTRSKAARRTPVQRVSVRTSGTGDIDALTAFLSFADTSRFPMVVTSMTVMPRPQSLSPDGGTALSIDFVISGLLKLPELPSPERVR
jgi:Type II secretion system (T2SS), protein M subtype b